MDFIHYNALPKNTKVTQASFLCDHRPLKAGQWRTRLVIGGDKLPYHHDTSSPAANLLRTKSFSTVSYLTQIKVLNS